MNELIKIADKTDVEIFTGDYLDTLTAEIQAAVDAHEADVTTDSGRKATKSFAAKIAKAKVRADEAGKSLNAERRALCAKVDERRRQLRDDFDRMRDHARKPVTEWEEAEAARKDAERLAIQSELERKEQERLDAIRKREEELERREAELAEAEALRAEKEAAEATAKERLELEARIKAEAAEKAKRDAQEAIDRAEREQQEAVDREEASQRKAAEDAREAVIEAAKETERQRLLAEQAAELQRIAAKEEKERAVKAERDRIAAEKFAEEKAAERREADKKHKARINNEAAEALFVAVQGITPAESKQMVVSIAKGLIPHVKINY